MIYGFTHPGSGLGNSLHRLIAGKVLAEDKGYEFSIIGRENFKGSSFMNLDFGLLPPKEWNYIIDPSGKIIVDTHWDGTNEWEEKTNYYNPEFNFIEDNTIIDGEFQAEQYFKHRLDEVNDWLKVDPIDIGNNTCIIGFRGGEFYVYPELGLPPEYFKKGIEMMKAINPNMKFEVHTDDGLLADKFFRNLDVHPLTIVQNMELNWRSMRYAQYAIIANSSFYIFPRLLSGGMTIAPRWWARHNTREWSRPDNYYKSFTYIHV